MEHGRTDLNEAVRSVQLLRFDGYCATNVMHNSYVKSRWCVGGHEWELRFYPNLDGYLALQLILVSESQRNKLTVNLSCRLVDPSQRLDPSTEKSVSYVFPSQPGWWPCKFFFMPRFEVPSSGYLVNDSLTVKCTVTVLKELPDVVIPANTAAPLPPSDLYRHLGELLQGRRGADVSFVVESGERFVAHKAILGARSPVFMAEFFGQMNERTSRSVSIQGVEADVFKAMLHFIYTDRAPELDGEPEFARTMAQHLLAAADRYGLERLKLICESKLAGDISIDTVATTLALAEKHNCSLLKAKCVDFIVRSPETLDAVLATEGYNHLFSSCPLVVTQLLRAVHGRRI